MRNGCCAIRSRWPAEELLIVDELGFVPLSKSGAELLFEVFSQRYERGSTLVTSNRSSVPGVDGSSRLGAANRCAAGPTHPPCSHPGDERRELPPEAEQTQASFTAELLIANRAPRLSPANRCGEHASERRTSSAPA